MNFRCVTDLLSSCMLLETITNILIGLCHLTPPNSTIGVLYWLNGLVKLFEVAKGAPYPGIPTHWGRRDHFALEASVEPIVCHRF